MIDCEVCTPNVDTQIALHSCVHRCKYHKEFRKNKYTFQNIVPRNLCPDLFYIAYPFCLAFLYDATIDKKKKRVVSCPNPKANVKIEIKLKPIIFKSLINKIERLARKYWRPLNLPDKRILLRIVSVDGDCPRGHKKNQDFEFNIGFFSELCPASFHSIYPFIFLIARKRLSRFSDTRDSIKIGCPDIKNKITYKIQAQS